MIEQHCTGPELAALMVNLERGGQRERVRVVTIGQATDLWLGELARLKKSQRTRDTYRRVLDAFAGDYPRDDVDEITPTKCRRFLDRWSSSAPATIAQKVSILNGFFDWLVDERLVPRSPMERINRPSIPNADENDNVVTVTATDVALLLREADAGGRWDERLAVNCLVYLGPRRHAIACVRRRDYDPLERTLTFAEKGAKTIRKPCPDRLAELIDAAIAAGVYGDPDDYLVPSRAVQRRKGERDDRVIWKIVREVAGRAGVTTHVHALRAAFAVQFLRSKPGQLVALQKLMGHQRIETTMHYLRRLNRQEAMETVRDLVWPDNTGFPQRAEIQFEALPVAEKEGFEPSMEAFTPITP